MAMSSGSGLDTCSPYLDLPANITLVGLGSLAYGVHIAIASVTIFLAARHGAQRKIEHLRRYRYFVVALLGFSSANYSLSMVSYIGLEAHSNSPSAPVNWQMFAFSAVIMAIIVGFLCNLLLLHRCYIVWNRWKPILAFPGILLIGATVSTTVGVTVTLGRYAPQHSFWPILIVLNLTLSTLISGRIIFIHRRLDKLVGNSLSYQLKGSTATTVAIFMESSILYTIVSLVGIPLWVNRFNVTDPIPYTFSPLLVHTECIASELIILRVILGQAINPQWTSATTKFISTVHGQTIAQDGVITETMSIP